MKIKRIAHLGIAVKDLDPPKKLYTENLGLKLKGDEVVETQKVKVSFIQVGESNLELLLPTAADSAGGQVPGKQGRRLPPPGPGGGGYPRRGGGIEGRGSAAHR